VLGPTVTNIDLLYDQPGRARYCVPIRLIRADRGEVAVDGSGQASIVYGSETPWLRRWWLDNLGNWSGGDEYGGSLAYGPDGDGAFDAEPPPESVCHVVNAANQVERVVLGPTVTNIDLLYDQAGNIVFDGGYYLQYDAMTRRVQVNP